MKTLGESGGWMKGARRSLLLASCGGQRDTKCHLLYPYPVKVASELSLILSCSLSPSLQKTERTNIKMLQGTPEGGIGFSKIKFCSKFPATSTSISGRGASESLGKTA